MEDKIKELKDRTDKLRWDIFKEKEVSKLVSHIFNTTKVIFEQNMTR